MLQVNQATLVGYVGGDPKTHTGKSGTDVTTFSLCTTMRWRTADGEAKEQSEWHRIVAFGNQATAAAKMVRKGDPLMVLGRVSYREYTPDDGITRKVTEIVVGGRGAMINVLVPGRGGEDGVSSAEEGHEGAPDLADVPF